MKIDYKNFFKKKQNCNICNLDELSLKIIHYIFVDKNSIDEVIERLGEEYYLITNIKLEKKDIDNHINNHLLINELKVAINNVNNEINKFVAPVIETNVQLQINKDNKKSFVDVVKNLDTVDEKVKFSTKYLEEKLNKIVEQGDDVFKHIADKIALNKIQCETIASYIKTLRDGQIHDLKISKLSNIDRELELKSIFLALKDCFVLALEEVPMEEELKEKFNSTFQIKVAENFKTLKIEKFSMLLKDKKQKFF